MTVYRVEGVEDVSDEIAIKPKEVKPKLQVETVLLRPELSLKEAEDKWINKPIDPTSIKYRPSVNTFYRTGDGKAKLLFLRDVLDADIRAKAYARLQQLQPHLTSCKNSKRRCLRGSPGAEAIFGYTDNLAIVAPTKMSPTRRQTHPQWTAPSVKQFPAFRGLWPLCWQMEDMLNLYIPDYWADRTIDDKHGPAVRGEGERNDFFQYPESNRKLVEAWDDFNLFYNIPGSNFASMSVNWNTRFLAHKDWNNSSGALSCLATFGTFAGGELCFPRLGVALNVKPGDMLACDCPQELHGTLSTPQGNRYSVVVYTREGLTKAGIGAKIAAKNAKAGM